MKVCLPVQVEGRAVAHTPRVSLSGRNTKRPPLLPRMQSLQSTPPTASLLSCPSSFPAFAEAFCSIGGLFVEAISEQWNQLRFIEPPDFCATQELALRVS